MRYLTVSIATCSCSHLQCNTKAIGCVVRLAAPNRVPCTLRFCCADGAQNSDGLQHVGVCINRSRTCTMGCGVSKSKTAGLQESSKHSAAQSEVQRQSGSLKRAASKQDEQEEEPQKYVEVRSRHGVRSNPSCRVVAAEIACMFDTWWPARQDLVGRQGLDEDAKDQYQTPALRCCLLLACLCADGSSRQVDKCGTAFQVRDVGSGAFGVCKLMKNTRTGELVAVKLMERGDKVRGIRYDLGMTLRPPMPLRLRLCRHNPMQAVAVKPSTADHAAADRHQRGAGGAEPQAAGAPKCGAVQGGAIDGFGTSALLCML